MKKIELQADRPPARIKPRATSGPRLCADVPTRATAAHVRRSQPRATSPTPPMPARETADWRVAALWCETVHGRVTDVLPILAPGIAYGRHDLCGQAFIARLQPCWRQQVDACLAELVMRGALPLEAVLDDCDGPARYRLKEVTGKGVSPSAILALLDTHPEYEG